MTQHLQERFTAGDRLQDFSPATSRALIERLAAFEQEISALIGDWCGKMEGLDRADGLRMILTNGDIVYLRPSDNTPKQRCYTEAAYQARGDRLMKVCLSR